MSQTCTVCRHAKRWDIEKAIIDGESLRDIARHFRLSKDAVARHKALSNTLVKAHEAQEVARADDLLAQVCRQEALFAELDQTAKAIQESAIREKDRHCTLDAISVRGNLAHKRRAYIELRGRITGELSDSNPGAMVKLVRVITVPRIGESIAAQPPSPLEPRGAIAPGPIEVSAAGDKQTGP